MASASEVLASSFVPLRDRHAEWDARQGMIHGAQRFLYSSTYYVGPDETGREVLGSLGDAARRGVQTTLLIDRFGQWLGASAWGPRENRRVNRWLRDAADRGVQILWTSPSSWTRTLVGGGHHVKIQVSERGPALFASSNLSRHSFTRWGEFSALLDGPIVDTLLGALHAVMPHPVEQHSEPRPSGPDPVRLSWWWCDPSADPTPFAPLRQGRNNPVTDGLVSALDQAERTVSITSFYVKPEPRLRQALIAAAQRGVQVEIFHSGPDALGGAEASWLAAALDYPALLAAGVAIHEVDHGEHSKLVVVDESLAVFGSYNLDHAAHDVVAEAMLASRDPRVVDPVLEVFATLRSSPGTRRITTPRAGWSRRRRAHARLVRPFRRWL